MTYAIFEISVIFILSFYNGLPFNKCYLYFVLRSGSNVRELRFSCIQGKETKKFCKKILESFYSSLVTDLQLHHLLDRYTLRTNIYFTDL